MGSRVAAGVQETVQNVVAASTGRTLCPAASTSYTDLPRKVWSVGVGESNDVFASHEMFVCRRNFGRLKTLTPFAYVPKIS
jgi:hypothetical protein